MVLVDTSIWSLTLRRSSSQLVSEVATLSDLIQKHIVILIGPIRQEILSGIKGHNQFERIREQLAAFPNYEIKTEDYETAAEFYNLCRSKGIQGSNTDFLICAVAVRNHFKIYTSDKDFYHYAKILKIKLYEV